MNPLAVRSRMFHGSQMLHVSEMSYLHIKCFVRAALLIFFQEVILSNFATHTHGNNQCHVIQDWVVCQYMNFGANWMMDSEVMTDFLNAIFKCQHLPLIQSVKFRLDNVHLPW